MANVKPISASERITRKRAMSVSRLLMMILQGPIAAAPVTNHTMIEYANGMPHAEEVVEREEVEDEHEAEEHRERQEQVAHVELQSAK